MKLTPEQKLLIRDFVDERCNELYLYATSSRCNNLKELMDPDAQLDMTNVHRLLSERV